MTPEIFRAKWQTAAQSETAGAQEHFIDLCRLLELPTPTEADPSRTWYRFEKNVLKLDGRPGDLINGDEHPLLVFLRRLRSITPTGRVLSTVPGRRYAACAQRGV